MTLNPTQSIAHSDSVINVALKIIKVAREIPPIAKVKISNRGGGFESEAVLVEVSERLQDNNLWIMPSSTGVDVVDTEYLYHYEYMVVDGDSGEWIIMPFQFALPRGEMKWDGNAKQLVWKVADKAASIAHTSAYRIFLTELFQITTPDAEANRQRKTLPSQPAPNDRRFGTPPSPQNKPAPAPTVTPVDVHVDEDGDIILPDAPPTKATPSAAFIRLCTLTDKELALTDTDRRAIISTFTDGRTDSRKLLSAAEITDLYDLLTVEKLGRANSEVWATRGRSAFAESASLKRTKDLWMLRGDDIGRAVANMERKLEQKKMTAEEQQDFINETEACK